MLKIVNGKIECNYQYCQQCGACSAACPKGAVSMVPLENGLKQIIVDDNLCIHCKKCVNVCPANRIMSMSKESDAYFDSFPQKKYFLAWNADKHIRRMSSSGGATKTIIIESLKSGFVDGVYSLRKLKEYPSAIGEFYTHENIPSYEDLPNSVYHSIMACTEIDKVRKVHRLMIVGTSCQLYALEKALKGKYDELVKVCIFCKQQKTLESTKWLAKVLGSRFSAKNFSAEYRGIGWPGFVRINKKSIAWERAAGLPFGRRLWVVPGCDNCGDPFGTEVGADISVMDPWKISCTNDLGETLIAIHTKDGLGLVHSLPSLVTEEKDYNDVCVALGLDDVWRKRKCVDFFLGNPVPADVEKAAKLEMAQRMFLEKLLAFLPRLPFVCFRLLNKIIPHKRDSVLQYTSLRK